MRTGLGRHNAYFLLAATAWLAGCETPEEGKEVTVLRVHLEAPRPDAPGAVEVTVLRTDPIEVWVNKNPILSETQVASARIIDQPDTSFYLEVQFAPVATQLLENYTASLVGRRLAIMSDFDGPRWLAAPVLMRPVRNGILIFTPDATHFEVERLVRGLNRNGQKMRDRGLQL